MDSGFGRRCCQRAPIKWPRRKGIRLWNLTTATISEFQLSPAGKTDVGPQPDPERQGQGSRPRRAPAHHRGASPAAMTPRSGYPGAKHCFVRDIEIKADAVFSIADKDLKDCNT